MNEEELVIRDGVLDRIDRARQALAECKIVQEAKKIADVAHAAQIYAKRQGMAQEVIEDAYEIRIRAMIKLGEIRANSPKATGTRGQLVSRGVIGATQMTAPINEVPTNAELGITEHESADAQLLYHAQDLIEDMRQPLTKIVATVRRLWRKLKRTRRVVPTSDNLELRIGDCRKVLADVPDDSIPLILTDPPYGDKAEPLYQWLAEFAAAKLIDGGSLVCFTGQSRLDRDMRIFSEHLRWWWLLIMPHHQSQRFPGKFVIAGFKPVLWFVKNHRRGRTFLPDVLQSPKREKDEHDWGQGEGGINSVIDHLTEDGELVVDPFAGTCRWGEITVSMGRRWLGADIAKGGSEDIDKQTAQIAAQRLTESKST